MNRQKNHFSSHHDLKLAHSEYTIGSDSFSTRGTFRSGDGNTRCETVGGFHGSCVNSVNRVSITDHSQSFWTRPQTFTHTLWHRGSVEREYWLILLGSWMSIQTGVWWHVESRWVFTEGKFFFFPRFFWRKKWGDGDRKWGDGVSINGVRPCERPIWGYWWPYPVSTNTARDRVIEDLYFVIKLSFVTVHKDEETGFRTTLSYYFVRGYDVSFRVIFWRVIPFFYTEI